VKISAFFAKQTWSEYKSDLVVSAQTSAQQDATAVTEASEYCRRGYEAKNETLLLHEYIISVIY